MSLSDFQTDGPVRNCCCNRRMTIGSAARQKTMLLTLQAEMHVLSIPTSCTFSKRPYRIGATSRLLCALLSCCESCFQNTYIDTWIHRYMARR